MICLFRSLGGLLVHSGWQHQALASRCMPAAVEVCCRWLLDVSDMAACGDLKYHQAAAYSQQVLMPAISSSCRNATDSGSSSSSSALARSLARCLTTCSSSMQHSSSSLRADLGSGTALGALASADSAGTESRRQSLLSNSGRFFDTVSIAPYAGSAEQPQSSSSDANSSDQQGYQLLLRKYPIKTPAKHLLVLPTYSLALAVAAEWEWLPKGKPVPHLMPLMSLAATAIDQPRERSKVIEHCLKYVHTDGACIRYEPGPLERRQARLFDPLLQWARHELGWQLHTSDSIAGTTQPAETVAAVQHYLEGLDRWQLAAAEQLITASKSVVIAAAVLQRRMTVDEAIAAARVEEDFQLEDWGMVEAGHDLDIADIKTRLGAPSVFAGLLALP